MNLVAAIVVPLDDNSVKHKYRRDNNAMLFTQAERVKLWNGYVPSDWYWTFGRSTSEWFDFKERLTAAITQDGFNISWVVLTGPDYFEINKEPPVPNWDCKEGIVSNVSRPPYFAPCEVSVLTTLSGCEAWKELMLDIESGTEDEPVRVCRKIEDAHCTVRFLPTKSTMENMSSTQVQEIIKSNPSPEQLHLILKDLVLYPDILLAFVLQKEKQYPWNTSRCRPQR